MYWLLYYFFLNYGFPFCSFFFLNFFQKTRYSKEKKETFCVSYFILLSLRLDSPFIFVWFFGVGLGWIGLYAFVFLKLWISFLCLFYLTFFLNNKIQQEKDTFFVCALFYFFYCIFLFFQAPLIFVLFFGVGWLGWVCFLAFVFFIFIIDLPFVFFPLDSYFYDTSLFLIFYNLF